MRRCCIPEYLIRVIYVNAYFITNDHTNDMLRTQHDSNIQVNSPCICDSIHP